MNAQIDLTEGKLQEFNNLFNKQASHTEIPDIRNRKRQLARLKDSLWNNRQRFHKALSDDFSKPAEETDLTELWPVLTEIKHALSHLKDWSEGEHISAPLSMIGTSSHVHYEPKGVVLIISPWNFPVNLTLGPLVSALAAGNRVILKPSEMTPHTSALMKEIIQDIYPEEEVALVEGAVEETKHLLSLPFDHIFFTGSPAIGKKVMEAAAQNLTSVTLELGGKSPVFIDENVSLADATEKIIWGKFMNNGQTCVAPDYALVHQKHYKNFLKQSVDQITKIYPGEIKNNKDYSRMVNEKHYHRVKDLIEDALDKGGEIVSGGNYSDRYIAPTIIGNASFDMKVMQEEIFGPVLPVMSVESIKESLELINHNPNPLAAYIFTKNTANRDVFIKKLKSGAICVNECVMHYAHQNLPFGGVRMSGTGRAHGVYGFKEFSNAKPVLRQRVGLTNLKFFYPPYNNFKRTLINILLKYL